MLNRWLVAKVAASTVNHRRTALQHLWNRLDGPDAPNPVRRAMKAKEPEAQQRALTYTQVRRILDALPDVGQGLAGQARDDASKTKARIEVLAFTGLPAAQVKALTPADVNLETLTITVRARRKGKGATGRELLLTRGGG